MNRYEKLRKAQAKAVFDKLKIGMRVYDTWYGPGKVIKKTARRCLIQLSAESMPWNYDVQHVEHFIRIGWSK